MVLTYCKKVSTLLFVKYIYNKKPRYYLYVFFKFVLLTSSCRTSFMRKSVMLLTWSYIKIHHNTLTEEVKIFDQSGILLGGGAWA